MRTGKKIRLAIILSALVLTSLFSGCATRSALRYQEFSKCTRGHQYLDGVRRIQKEEKLYGSTNAFLYYYDMGLLNHYAGQLDSSTFALTNAERIAEALFTRSISNEAAALVTNDNIRPYRPWIYEKLLGNQIMSLNYASLGRYEDALVESRKADLFLTTLKDAAGSSPQFLDNGMSDYISSIWYNCQGAADDEAIALFKAINAYRKSALPLPAAVARVGAQTFARTGRMQDIDSLKLNAFIDSAQTASPSNTSEIILVGYAGLGPILGETTFWGTYVVGGFIIGQYIDPTGTTVTFKLPAPPLPTDKDSTKTAVGTTFTLKFSLPQIINRPSDVRAFTAVLDSNTQADTSVSLSNSEASLMQELTHEYPGIILRTAVRVAIRTIAAQKAKERMNSNDAMMNLLLNGATDVLAVQLEKADTRSCFLIPRTIEMIRLPVSPGVHHLKAVAHTGNGTPADIREWNDIAVKQGEKKVLVFPALY